MMNIYKIRSIRKFLTTDACKTIVLGLVISHLDYNNAILYGLPDVDINKLQRIQNMAAKLICKKRKFDSAKDSLKELHWLPIRARSEHKVLSVVHGCVYRYGPKYLIDLIVVKDSVRSLRSADINGLMLEVPRTKYKTFGDRSFAVAAPKLWNQLPKDIKAISAKNSFKKSIKTFLFCKYFN